MARLLKQVEGLAEREGVSFYLISPPPPVPNFGTDQQEGDQFRGACSVESSRTPLVNACFCQCFA